VAGVTAMSGERFPHLPGCPVSFLQPGPGWTWIGRRSKDGRHWEITCCMCKATRSDPMPEPVPEPIARGLTVIMLAEACEIARDTFGPRFTRDQVAEILQRKLKWVNGSEKSLKRAQDELQEMTGDPSLIGWPPKLSL